jgi:peptide/nickel transport system permease protein
MGFLTNNKKFQSIIEKYESRINELKLMLAIIRRSPLTLLGLILVTGFIVLGIIGPFIAPYDPVRIDFKTMLKERLQPPSWKHWFGTDEYGRDIFSRVLVGARISLMISLAVIAVAVPIGIILGLLAGYFGGVVDEVIMRTTDIFLSFPALVLAIAFSATLGAGIWSAMIALALVWWPGYVRVIRAQTLSVRESLFIEAAKAMGVKTSRILFKHILPNVITPLIVLVTLDFGSVILTSAALSFIGLGAQPPTPEWGRLVADGRKWFPTRWWYTFFPGMAIFLTVLGWNLLGDGLRDILDPRFRRRIEFGGKGD